MKINTLFFNKIYTNNQTLFLPQEYFRHLVKPIVNKVGWNDSGDHLERLNSLSFFLIILLMDSKNAKQKEYFSLSSPLFLLKASTCICSRLCMQHEWPRVSEQRFSTIRAMATRNNVRAHGFFGELVNNTACDVVTDLKQGRGKNLKVLFSLC